MDENNVIVYDNPVCLMKSFKSNRIVISADVFANIDKTIQNIYIRNQSVLLCNDVEISAMEDIKC